MAPVYRSLKNNSSMDVKLISTGQHREMSQQAFDAFELQPDVELDLMTQNQTLSDFSSRAIAGLSRCFVDLDPDVVLVHGDTTTTLAGSLAAFYLKKRVGHVEAGMRTGNINSPWPEEMNRRLTAPLCHWHFVPVARNLNNLVNEGISRHRCFLTGNTVIDALFWMRDKLQNQAGIIDQVQHRLGVSDPFFKTFLAEQTAPFLLVTGHRRESHGEGIENLCQALLELSRNFPSLGILYPVHPNPNVRKIVLDKLSGHERIAIIDPLDYCDFVWIMQRCFAIISDSGGIQSEAMSLGKPLLVTRDSTEYPEALETGGCQLVSTQTSSIVEAATILLTDSAEYNRRCQVENPYGDGKAADRIAAIISNEI